MVIPLKRTRARSLCLAALSAAAALIVPSTAVHAGLAVAVTDNNRLVRFDTSSPASLLGNVAVSGLDAGEQLVGIDFRPAQPNALYGLGSLGQVYRVNPASGVATKVGAPLDPATVPLTGLNFGFDFNPTVDRIRVVSDLGENYRLNPNDGSLSAADLPLAFKPGDANAGFPPAVGAVAYTNSRPGPTPATTVLYGIDSEAGALVTISPPNDGVLNTVGLLNVSTLPLFTGFDIDGDNKAFASTKFEAAGGGFSALNSTLFGIDLQSGEATELGIIGDGSLAISGFAVSNAPSAVPLPPAVFAAPLAGLIGWFYTRRMRNKQVAD